jgi:hypothetical protein
MSTKEKVAYLKGLLTLGFEDEATKRIFLAVVDALNEVAVELDEHAEILEEQQDMVDGLSDDFDALDDEVTELRDAVCDGSDECACENCREDDDDDDDDDEDEFDVTYVSRYVYFVRGSVLLSTREYGEEEKLQCRLRW